MPKSAFAIVAIIFLCTSSSIAEERTSEDCEKYQPVETGITTDTDCACLKNPQSSSSSRWVPFYRRGSMIALRLFAVQADGCHSQLGMKNVDLIRGINGVDISLPENIELQGYSSGSHPLDKMQSVKIERDGKIFTLKCHY